MCHGGSKLTNLSPGFRSITAPKCQICKRKKSPIKNSFWAGYTGTLTSSITNLMQKVSMGEHHTLGISSGSTGIYKCCYII